MELFHFNGDEFAILIEETDIESFKKIISNILYSVNSTDIIVKQERIPIQITVGISAIDNKRICLRQPILL